MSQIKSLRTGIKFKETPIGKIPVDWEVTSLEKISFLEYGASLPEKKRFEGPIPVYGSNGIIGYHNEKLINGPGIIIGRKGTVGAVTWADNDFWPIDTTYFVSKAQCKGNLELRWFYYLLFNLRLEKLNAATGIPGINRSAIHSLIIPLPPLPEQKKIAEILITVDGAIEETDRIIEKTKELKKGLMQRLLTRGIKHKKFKKSEIGEIPVEWKISRLGDLSKGKPEYGANVTAIDRDDKLPRYIRITDITDDGYLLNDSWKSIYRKSAELYILREGDFLFARSGATVGKTYSYKREDGECAFAGYLIRFRPDASKLLPEFLFQITHSDFYYNWVKSMLRAGAQPNINGKEYSNLMLPAPSINEQRNIVKILTSVDDEIKTEMYHRQNLETLKKSLMQVLLTGKIRVKLH